MSERSNWRDPDPKAPPKPETYNETCLNWFRGTCQKSNCDRAHFFYPIIAHRSHRGGSKTKRCYSHSGPVPSVCDWADDVCGFAHQAIDEADLKSKQDEVIAHVNEQRWTEEIKLRCKECSVFSVTVKNRFSIDDMVKHCHSHITAKATGGDGGGIEGGWRGSSASKKEIDKRGPTTFGSGAMGQVGKKGEEQ